MRAKPLCEHCHDMRLLAYDVEPGDSRFSKVVPCPFCATGRDDGLLERICGLSGEMRGWTFANTRRTRSNADAFDSAAKVAAEPRWFFSVFGLYGVGKTRLLACIVNAGRAAGLTSVYMTTAGLLSHLRATYAPDAPHNFDETWDRVTRARILALDELDRWNPTPWAQEKFFELIDYRYREGERALTVFASNARLEGLPGYLTSRMSDYRCAMFTLEGPDQRRVGVRPPDPF
jgi:DNA replication protein DnaC